ncbi:membrane protein [Spirochaetia bacterium]|nr:membrane protein [Spirochaetia bacterium]
MNVVHLLLTFLAGGAFGAIGMVSKIPNGLRIGAMIGAALLSIFFSAAWMPRETRFLVQIIAGAMIGCTTEKSDLKRLPAIIKPMGITVVSLFFLNIIAGALVHALSPLNWVTSFMGGIPGGVTDTPIIAAEMGADVPAVAMVQLARYIMGIALFPPMILAYDTLRMKRRRDAPRGPSVKREKSGVSSWQAFLCTMIAAGVGGFIGRLTHIPAGTFLFSIIAVMILKLKFDFAWLPSRAKRFAQFISGCYIGGAITMGDVRNFKFLAIPIGIVLTGYIINCFFTGAVLTRFCGFSRMEGMLITTPAGATDIALSAADMGITNTDIIIIQIFRSVIAIAVFPQIINLLLLFLK